MIKTYKEIGLLYRAVYKELDNNRSVLTSEEFWCPTLNEVTEAISKHSVVSLPHIKNISDCEKHAWYLQAGIQRERSDKALSIPIIERYTWSFGWCIGMRTGIFGTQSHTMCTALTSDVGIIIIESESNVIEEPDVNKFNILFICM